MFCARCGEQIPDASELCPLCGRETTIQLQPQPAAVRQPNTSAVLAQPQLTTPSISSRDRGLQGVGGWLLFFCIALIILGPLATFAEVMSLSNIDAAGMILEFARAGFGIVVGIFLWNVRPVAFTLLWVYFAFVALMGILGIIGFAVLEQKRPEDLTVSVRALIYVVVWFLYFHQSKRVRVTFGRNL